MRLDCPPELAGVFPILFEGTEFELATQGRACQKVAEISEYGLIRCIFALIGGRGVDLHSGS